MPKVCKSHYDTLTCTHRVIVPTAEEWDSAIEARAADLRDFLWHAIDMADGEHDWEAVRLNAESLLKRDALAAP